MLCEGHRINHVCVLWVQGQLRGVCKATKGQVHLWGSTSRIPILLICTRDPNSEYVNYRFQKRYKLITIIYQFDEKIPTNLVLIGICQFSAAHGVLADTEARNSLITLPDTTGNLRIIHRLFLVRWFNLALCFPLSEMGCTVNETVSLHLIQKPRALYTDFNSHQKKPPNEFCNNTEGTFAKILRCWVTTPRVFLLLKEATF